MAAEYVMHGNRRRAKERERQMRDRPIEQISRIAFARSEMRPMAALPPSASSPPVPHQVGLTNDAPRSPRRHLNITECLDAARQNARRRSDDGAEGGSGLAQSDLFARGMAVAQYLLMLDARGGRRIKGASIAACARLPTCGGARCGGRRRLP